MRILILASNPRRDLSLDDEIRILRSGIDRSPNRSQFEVISETGVLVGDLQRLLLQYKPQIVHFCGHGGGEEGLIFKLDGGGEQRVRAEALATLFGLNPICNLVKCVLLNACYSKEQADAIVNYIDYVVGMSHEIQDQAAIAFSKGFYLALGEGCSIDDAFEFGRNAIQLEISGSSKVFRSATMEQQRKLEVVNDITKAEIPEHLKPILRRKQASNQSSEQKVLVSEQPLSPEKQKAIQLGIVDALIEEESSLQRDQKVAKLYKQAHDYYHAGQWQRVIEIINREIWTINATYPDPNNLLQRAQDRLRDEERRHQLVELYNRGQYYLHLQNWQKASEKFEQIIRIDPNYRNTSVLIAEINRKLYVTTGQGFLLPLVVILVGWIVALGIAILKPGTDSIIEIFASFVGGFINGLAIWISQDCKASHRGNEFRLLLFGLVGAFSGVVIWRFISIASDSDLEPLQAGFSAFVGILVLLIWQKIRHLNSEQ